jgi:hypothetical protein
MIPPLVLEAAGSFLWKHWKSILGLSVIIGLSVALILTRGTLEREKLAHAKTKADYAFAQEVATLEAERARREAEDQYRRNADEANDLHAVALANATDAATRYIERNRVRTQDAQCPSSRTTPAPESGSASVPETAPAASELVAVTETDIRACSAAVAYGDAAFEWAGTLERVK